MYKNQHKWLQIALILLDGVISVLALTLAGIWRFGEFSRFIQMTAYTQLVLITLFACPIAFMVSGMYKDFFARGYLRELQHTVVYDLYLLLLVTLYTFATKNSVELSRLTMLYNFILVLLIVYVAHIAVKYIGIIRARGHKGWKLLVIADADNAAAICHNIQKSDWKNRTIGVIMIDGKTVEKEQLCGLSLIHPTVSALEYIVQNTVDEVLLSVEQNRYWSDEVQALLAGITETGAVLSVRVFFPAKEIPYVSRLEKIGSAYVLSFADRSYDYAMIMLKRLIDIVGGLIGSAFTLLIGLFLAPMILLESPGPLFFRQKRVGRNGRIFTMLKFRSMYADAEERKKALITENQMNGLMFKMKNDPRITHVGKFIRKTSLDEFPQFFNVLAGDMSLVGTRPPTMDEYQQYTGAQKKRLSFRPGITGLWQVSGRNDITDFSEVIKLDLQYIQDWSIYLDIKLILKTMLVALLRKGAE